MKFFAAKEIESKNTLYGTGIYQKLQKWTDISSFLYFT